MDSMFTSFSLLSLLESCSSRREGNAAREELPDSCCRFLNMPAVLQCMCIRRQVTGELLVSSGLQQISLFFLIWVFERLEWRWYRLLAFYILAFLCVGQAGLGSLRLTLWRVEVHGKRLSFFSDTATRWRNEIEMEIRDYRKVNIFFWFMISFVLIFFWLQDYSSRWDMIYRPVKMKTSFLIILLVRTAVTGWRFRFKMSKLKAASRVTTWHGLGWSHSLYLIDEEGHCLDQNTVNGFIGQHSKITKERPVSCWRLYHQPTSLS